MAASETITLSRRERERLMRRQAILEAAQAVFAEKGYENATLDEIAQRAEFGKGTLYNYFEGGKEDILFSIFDEIHEGLLTLIQESFAPDPANALSSRELFHGFLMSCFEFYEKHQHLFMILIKEGHQMYFSEDREKAGYFQKQRNQMVKALVQPLEKAQQKEHIKELPMEAVAHMIMGNINGVQTHLSLVKSGLHQEDEPDITCPEEAADFLTIMLWDGLKTAGESRTD